MATRRQRAARHTRRVQHGLDARAKRAEALASLPAVASMKEIDQQMAESGYERDERGKWRRRFFSPKRRAS